MEPGIYKFYYERGGQPANRKYLGRIAVINGHTTVLEDHADLAQVIPDGFIDDKKLKRWHQLENSAYYAVEPEVDLEPNEVPADPVKPDEVFMLRDDRIGSESRLEIYGDEAFLDDKHLTPAQLEELMTNVRNKYLHLIPIA